jgi:hypothetical protein
MGVGAAGVAGAAKNLGDSSRLHKKNVVKY